jgi:hypothetical protein
LPLAHIISRTNSSIARDFTGRPLTTSVNTAWTDVATSNSNSASHTSSIVKSDSASNIPTLSCMPDLGCEQTDIFMLSMAYQGVPTNVHNGGFGLGTQDEKGSWVNAVDTNIGSTANNM